MVIIQLLSIRSRSIRLAPVYTQGHNPSPTHTHTQLTMAVSTLLPFFAALAVLLAQPPSVAAYAFGVGDGLAIVLFIALGVVGVCALLGFIARRRAAS